MTPSGAMAEDDPTLSEETELTVTIDSISPAVLTPGEPVRLSGAVRNDADYTWGDAKVYFSITNGPASDRASLDAFALTGDEMVGETIYSPINLFDQIGDVPPGSDERYSLSIPWGQLPISQAAGVYHVGVTVIATPGDDLRDVNADARAGTVLPLLPETDHEPGELPFETKIATVLPVTAPVARQPDGSFVDDRLATDLSYGGRLRNELDFALQAPPDTLELAVDPALISAVTDMTQGYDVRPLTQPVSPDPDGGDDATVNGRGVSQAADWLEDLRLLTVTQRVSLLPWGTPDTSALAGVELPGVTESAYRASRRYGFDNDYGGSVLDWQNNGISTRSGIAVSQRYGAAAHLLSTSSLPKLDVGSDGYPPSLVSLTTSNGPVAAITSRTDLGGEPFSSDMTALDFRQHLLAEATVRALGSKDQVATSVIAAPFHWDPGTGASSVDLDAAYGADVIDPVRLSTVNDRTPTPYAGPVESLTPAPAMTESLVASITRLRDIGRVYVGILTKGRRAATAFEQQLALAGSSAWERQPRRGQVLNHMATRIYADAIAQVTVSGPQFIALSGDSGRFPLTVTNDLDVSVTVAVDVVPANDALKISKVDPITLGPGQRQSVDVVGKAQGSGLTNVRVRLATPEGRPFGKPADFDVRATKIGLFIWILMAVLGAALFSSAAVRIVKRLRSGGFRPRGETAL